MEDANRISKCEIDCHPVGYLLRSLVYYRPKEDEFGKTVLFNWSIKIGNAKLVIVYIPLAARAI